MAAKDDLGRAGERRALEHLIRSGFRVVDRNWRCSQGEIDIVAVERGTVVVVEVKARRTLLFGHPFEAIDARKRERLHRLAYAWARAHPRVARGAELRVDGIAVTGDDPRTALVEHLRDLR